MERRANDWRTILLIVLSLSSGLGAFLLTGLLLLVAILGAVNSRFAKDAPPLLDSIMLGSALALVGAFFLAAGYQGVQRLRGKDAPAPALKVLKLWQGILLFVLWVGSAVLAQVFFNSSILKWFTPPLYLISIATPVYFFIRLTAGGLDTGSRLRTWGVLFTSMSFGTIFSALAEIMLIVFALLGVGVYFGLHPEQAASFRHMMQQLANASRVDRLLDLVSPWLTSPLAIFLALAFFSGFTPLIEETAKSAAVWVVFNRLESPAQGFVIGALSGAGFGLFESLLASVTPDANWAYTLLIRGGSTMMHIMTASLTGWGIASFRANRNPWRAVGGYTLAMLLHATWNACVIFIVAGGVRVAVSPGHPDILGALMAGLGTGVLVMMALAMPVILGAINWKLRTSPSLTRPAATLSLPLPAPFGGAAREEAGRGQGDER